MADTPVLNSKVANWLLGICLTVMLGGGGAWLTSLHTNFIVLERDSNTKAERLSSLESEVRGLRTYLERIDAKLDRLIESRKP